MCEGVDMQKNQSPILIPYPPEKTAAIRKFCLKKGINLEDKCVELLDALYKKVVPKLVREYIDESEDLTAKEQKKT